MNSRQILKNGSSYTGSRLQRVRLLRAPAYKEKISLLKIIDSNVKNSVNKSTLLQREVSFASTCSF